MRGQTGSVPREDPVARRRIRQTMGYEIRGSLIILSFDLSPSCDTQAAVDKSVALAQSR